MNRLWLLLTGFVLVVLPAEAKDMLAPDPGLAPVRVVEIQLDALQTNDDPSPDAGIAQTWAFAHPDNRRVTGPLERFAAMIKGPHYRSLLGHREHDIKPVFRNENMAVFAVTIVTSEGEALSFQWQVAKVASGQFSGAWMTVGVSPPLRTENAI
ncbi:MAG: DUF4864 domain-containing protein [Rhodospirillales bacterium]|nr:DUF4864 domain-containing protein [Rhodospirillales bacterium]